MRHCRRGSDLFASVAEPRLHSNPGLERIRLSLNHLEDAPELRLKVRDHYEHLLQLAARLKALGQDDSTIDEHVVGIFEQYKTKLTRRIAGISAAPFEEGLSDGGM